MGRLQRVHAPHGTYYIQLRVNSGHVLFRHNDDIGEFNRLVANALSLCNARLHAFCWTTTEARFALQVSHVPAGRFVQLVAGSYSQRIHRRLGVSGCLFRRHRAILVLGDFYLLQLIRYIHWTPVRMGLSDDPSSYPWSSHHTYLGHIKQSWLTTAAVRGLLAVQNEPTYSQWMHKRPSENEALQFERATRCVPVQLTAGRWIERARSRAEASKPADGSLDRIIDAVSIRLDVTRAELMSRSRRRRTTMARALVAWHALRSGLGTLTDVSRILHRHPSTLTVAIGRYRRSRADLFRDPL